MPDALPGCDAQISRYLGYPKGSPFRSLRICQIAAILTILIVALGFVASDDLFMICGIAAFVLAIFLLAAAASVAIRNWRAKQRSDPALSWARYMLFLLSMLVVSFAGLWMAGRVNRAGKECIWAVVSRANLRGIESACEMYQVKYGTYPSAFPILAGEGNVTSKGLIAPEDPMGLEAINRPPPGYSSYVYHAPAASTLKDPLRVFAYEREPWSRTEFRFFSERAHAVLFADGKSRLLRPAELKAAIQIDGQRRSEQQQSPVSANP